ncbi:MULTISPECIES: hypothetical protein [Halorubrum]|nr:MULTISPECIES: hypothetical protein [Halorubrum]
MTLARTASLGEDAPVGHTRRTDRRERRRERTVQFPSSDGAEVI